MPSAKIVLSSLAVLAITLLASFFLIDADGDVKTDGDWETVDSGGTVTVTIVRVTLVIDSNKSETVLINQNGSDLPIPTKEGYVFQGWRIATDHELQPIRDNIPNNSTLYAEWKGLSIIFYDCDGICKNIIINDKNPYEELILPQPTALGYLFDGWYTHRDYKVPFDGAGDLSDENYAYAKWIDAHVVTLNYNIDGAVEQLTVADNGVVIIPSKTFPHYTILGWYTDDDLTEEYDLNAPVTSDLTLYAKVLYEAPHTHVWYTSEVTKEPTCTDPGVRTYHCECGETKTEMIPQLSQSGEHSWDSGTVTKEPTLRSEGERLHKCTVCDATKTEVLPKLPCDHTWTNREVTKEPTCGSDGVAIYTCKDCGSEKDETVPATNEHHWDEGYIIPSNSDIIRGHRCIDCGRTMTSIESWVQNSFVNPDGSVRTVTMRTSDQIDYLGESYHELERTIVVEKDGVIIEKTTEVYKSVTNQDGTFEVDITTKEINGEIVDETQEINVISPDFDIVSNAVVKKGEPFSLDAKVKGETTDEKIASAIRQTELVKDMIGDFPSDIRATICVDHRTKISPGSIESLIEHDYELVVGSLDEKGALRFNNDALDRMYRVNENMQLVFNYVDYDRLSEPMKASLGDREAFEVSTWYHDETIHDWVSKDLELSFKIPDLVLKDPHIYWLQEDGTKSIMEDAKKIQDKTGDWWIIAKTNHLSVYFVDEGPDSDENPYGDEAKFHIYSGIVVMIIVAVSAVALYRRR